MGASRAPQAIALVCLMALFQTYTIQCSRQLARGTQHFATMVLASSSGKEQEDDGVDCEGTAQVHLRTQNYVTSVANHQSDVQQQHAALSPHLQRPPFQSEQLSFLLAQVTSWLCRHLPTCVFTSPVAASVLASPPCTGYQQVGQWFRICKLD